MIRSERIATHIRALEDEYWQAYREGNRSCREFIHDDFLGWPRDKLPQDKEGIVAHITGRRRECQAVNCAAITLSNSVALVLFARDANRICHTWIKDEDTWKLLGGMSRHGPAKP